LVINKVDLAPHVGASLEVMERDAKRMRGLQRFIFSNLRAGQGIYDIARFIEDRGGLLRLVGCSISKLLNEMGDGAFRRNGFYRNWASSLRFSFKLVL
jgi:hypothetical protein